MCPPHNTPSLDMKVEFVGSAFERRDHPFISLWTDGANVERAYEVPPRCPQENSPWSVIFYKLLKCLFLTYSQDIPRVFVLQWAPPSLSCQPSPRAEGEVPVSTEPV